jgi:hypothetical protein
MVIIRAMTGAMVLNATVNNISVLSWLSVLLVEAFVIVLSNEISFMIAIGTVMVVIV